MRYQCLRFSWRRAGAGGMMAAALAGALSACATAPPRHVADRAAPAATPVFVYSPYKDLEMGMAPQGALAMRGGDGGDVLAMLPGAAVPGPAPALTWAFATGECGEENWTGRPGQGIAEANLPAFGRAGVGYIISTGGALAAFTCASDAGMTRFIARYDTPQLIGFDFDIERNQSDAQIDALAQRLATVRRRHPQLRLSFTVATKAASDGSRDSLNATGETVLAALRRAGVDGFVLNLMVMDFGAALPANCVVAHGACDMAASARQAADNVSAKYGVPMAQIELTAMIGVNDVVANVFTLDDARATARLVRERKLAGLHYWSLDRDGPCATAPATTPPAEPIALPLCHGLAGDAAATRRAFHRAFADGLRD